MMVSMRVPNSSRSMCAVLLAGCAMVACGGSDGAAATTTTVRPVLTLAALTDDLAGCDQTNTPDGARFVAIHCGLTVEVLSDGGLTVTYRPTLDDGGGADALTRMAATTDCWSQTDLALMEQTRALDGRVASANGRTSWTYHPDDGLSIVCNSL